MTRNAKSMFYGQLRVMSDCEYDRINSEMQKRIGMIFSQGFTVVSLVAVIWSITITILGVSIGNENNEMNIFVISDNMWQLLLLGGFMTLMFAVPTFLIVPFAVKHHDNLRAISSLSVYIKVFYDLPSLLGKRTKIKDVAKDECTAWETIHCEVDVPNAKFFSAEYKIVALISMCLSAIMGIAVNVLLSVAVEKNFSNYNIVWIVIYSICFVGLEMLVFQFMLKAFRYSRAENAVGTYLQVYTQKYLRDAVDLGIITEEDYENYKEWMQTMTRRDEKLRNICVEIEREKRMHRTESRIAMELLNDVYDYETVCIPLKVKYLQKKLKITDKKGTLGRVYHGQEFDPEDAVYKELLRKSEDLCAEYTRLCGILKPNKRQESRKSEILDILFPDHGVIYGVGAGIHVVAGMVDLGDKIYINSNVCFNSDVHIRTGDYFICAPNVTFGSENKTNKVQNIIIENDVWIGADAKIARGAIIGKGCVVAMGARVQVEARLAPMTVYGGNPAFAIRKIEGARNDDGEETPELFRENLDFLKQHYLSLGIVRMGDDSTEFENFLRGKKYNSLNAFMGAVNSYSHSVCAANMIADPKRRESLLSKLFPIMGQNCRVGDNLQLDTIGSVILGNNVQIGDNVTLMGNISIGNNCKIGDNVSIIAVGHDVYYMGRHVTEIDHNPYMKNTSGYVIVDDGIQIRSGAKILASQTITADVEANILFLNGNKKIRL